MAKHLYQRLSMAYNDCDDQKTTTMTTAMTTMTTAMTTMTTVITSILQ